ncbi:MAG: hypothetical protein FWG45_01945 [Oscillospiraceae bacterium]|nr:hypothetical protein [Oscillospiraceae bacterium]
MEELTLRHNEKDELFKLLVIKHSPERIDSQIANTMAKMEQEDVEHVRQCFNEWLKIVGETT